MMTAVWASPIVTRTCSPVSLRSTRAVGSSSSIRWRAGPILSRSALVCGSIATISVGMGKSRGGRTNGRSFEAGCRRSTVTVSLATAPISPASSSPIASCSLPWRSSSWPIRSSSPCVEFQAWACEWSVPDSTRRYVSRPDERVGGGLEDADEERPVGSGGTAIAAPDRSVGCTGASSAGEGR